MQGPLPRPHDDMSPRDKGALLLRYLETGSSLVGLDFSGAHLKGLELQRVDLQRVDLSWGNLPLAQLRQANLQGANLQQANLLLANLQSARMKAARLTQATLQGAALQWADLSGTDLSGANLMRADLQGAYLQQSNLRGASLTRANLAEANLRGANLHHARTLEGTRIDPTTFYLSGWSTPYLETLVALGLLLRGFPEPPVHAPPTGAASQVEAHAPPGTSILKRIATPLEQGAVADRPGVEVCAGNLDPVRYFTWSDVQVSHDPVVCTVLLRPSADAGAMASDLSYCSFVRVAGRLVGRIASISLLSDPALRTSAAIVRLDIRP